MSGNNTRRRKEKKKAVGRKESPYKTWDEFFSSIVPGILTRLNKWKNDPSSL